MAHSMDKLQYSENAPKIMSLQLLKEITNNFSKERKLGSGTYGEVYKGVQNGEEIAVKMLRLTLGIDDLEQFKKEFENLRRLRHQNIVQLIGYCYEKRLEYVDLGNGRTIFAENIYRALCFEYMHNGSLQNYLHDEYHGFDWQTRYKIIKGICEGLKYLHEGLKSPIFHLDLKPDNVLLDKNMVPKLADFGLSKLIINDQTQSTQSSVGTKGYLPPEYIEKNLISKKFDIFSLGVVMIRIMTGYEGYFKKEEMSSQEFIDLVRNNWRNRLQAKLGCAPLEDELHQVKRCIEIALDCVKADREQRPEIGSIIHWLNETEHMTEKLAMSLPHETRHDTVSHVERASSSVCELDDEVQSITVSAAPSPLQRILCVPKGPGETSTEIRSLASSEISKLLDVHPLELCFPFEPNNDIDCPVTMSNMTDNHVSVRIRRISPDTRFDLHFQVSIVGDNLEAGSWSSLLLNIEPHSTLVVAMTMKEQQKPLPQSTGLFEVQMIVMRSRELLNNLKSATYRNLDMGNHFLKRVEELGGEMHRAMLTAVICDPANSQALKTHQFIPATSKFGSLVSSIDVHPTETWILVGHMDLISVEGGRIDGQGGYVSIWNYQTQERVMVLQVTKVSFVESANKFIAREQWFATGDGAGYVHVYSYSTKDKVTEFVAYRGKSVNSLAVHPSDRFLLTSSYYDTTIKLWDWGQSWICMREFDGHPRGVRHLTFNPRDASTFASVSIADNEVKVWEIHSSNPVTTLLETKSADYVFTNSHRHFMFACDSNLDRCAYIRNSQTGERVHKLIALCGQNIQHVACHQTHPILATTGADRSTIHLWDARTYRLEKMVRVANGRVEDMVFIGMSDSTRFFVSCSSGIAIVKINFQ